MIHRPEINLARRLLTKFRVAPPVPVRQLLEDRADLELTYIPFDVDAVCIGLKVPGRRPRVLINSRQTSLLRRRFTLAHELGHIVIPWHRGLIVDKVRARVEPSDGNYWSWETEANRFASELLMPGEWVAGIISQYKNPVKMLQDIIGEARVSFSAGLIKLMSELPSGYTYACTQDDVVIRCDASRGTFAARPAFGRTLYSYDAGDYAAEYFFREVKGVVHHWWRFETIPQDVLSWPEGEWREVLNSILDGFELEPEQRTKFRNQLNGIIAAVNSTIGEQRSPASIYDACTHRVRANARYTPLLFVLMRHARYEEFLKLRVKAFFEPPAKPKRTKR